MIEVNGIKIPDSVHQKFKEDFRVYREMIGEEDDEKMDCEVLLPQIIQDQAVLTNLVLSKNPTRFLMYLTVTSGSPLNVFELTEPLDYLMSEKNMTIVTNTIVGMIKFNPSLTSWIENMGELSSMEKLSLKNIHKTHIDQDNVYFDRCIIPNVADFKYRFSENVWILIKVGLFKYKVIRTFGLSHISMNDVNDLILSEKPQSILDELIRAKTLVYPTKISGLYRADNNTFELDNGSIYYKNGNRYHGNIMIDKDIGYLRHGYMGYFYSEDILEHSGRYIYDICDYDCENNRDDDVCYCDLCHCRRTAHESMFEEEDLDGEEERKIDQECCSRENYNNFIRLDTSLKNFPSFGIVHCSECLIHMTRDNSDFRIRKSRYWSKMLDLNLTESQIFNEKVFDLISKSRIDPLAEISIKSIENYEDYVRYIEPSPKILEERAQYFNEKRTELIQTIDRNYF